MDNNTAFPGPYAPGTPEMNKYDEYLQNQNGLMADQNNEPAASPGALSGEAAAPAAEPALQGEAMQPSAEQVFGDDYGKGGKDFFSHWRKANPEEREQLTSNLEELPNAAGKSLEGMMQEAYAQNPDVAAEIGAKYGFSPPNRDGGMPNFKLEQRALSSIDQTMMEGDLALAKGKEVLGQIEELNKKDDLKREKRHAMGAFLFEAGLRILASQRGDAAGAIGEGLIGTMEARRARAQEDEDRGMAKEDRTRRQAFEDSAETRRESAESRAKSKEERDAEAAEREAEIHEEMKKAGRLATGGAGQSVAEFSFDIFKRANADKGWNDQQLNEAFLEYQRESRKMTDKDRDNAIRHWVKYIEENGAGEEFEEQWLEMSGPEKRQWVIDNFGLGKDKPGTQSADDAEDYETLDW